MEVKRPEDIVTPVTRTLTSVRKAFAGTIKHTVSFGTLARVTKDYGFTLVVFVFTRSTSEFDLERGKEVFASFKAIAIHAIRL